MQNERSVIKKGRFVEIIPPKEFAEADFGTWVVIDIFVHDGKKHQGLPEGPSVRLHYPFHDDWLLPLENVRLSTENHLRSGPNMP